MSNAFLCGREQRETRLRDELERKRVRDRKKGSQRCGGVKRGDGEGPKIANGAVCSLVPAYTYGSRF